MSYNDSGKKDKDKPRIVKRTWTEEEDAQVMLGPCILPPVCPTRAFTAS